MNFRLNRCDPCHIKIALGAGGGLGLRLLLALALAVSGRRLTAEEP